MRYIAYYLDYLGKVCDTLEEAKKQARGMDFYIDAKTGFSSAFNCDVQERAMVREVPDNAPTVKQWLKMLEKYKEAKRKLDEEIERLREKRLGKFFAQKAAYINLNTNYEYNDLIELTIRLRSGRTRKCKARVCGSLVTKSGEIRPDLYDQSYPTDAEIVSIKVLEKYDFGKERQRTVCKNCKHFSRINHSFGLCDLHEEKVYEYKGLEDCYERDPEKK